METRGASDTPEPVVLIIADISGYTRYMTANARTLAHSQAIITELVAAIVRKAELPLEVAKLEGDAVFLFARKRAEGWSWPEAKKILAQKLFELLEVFEARADELGASNTCSCDACIHIERLKLKLIVHSGEALFHWVLNFQELAGVDVIIAHRLLKNSVGKAQYILLTEAAWKDVEPGENRKWTEGSETYDDLGTIRTRVHVPGESAGKDAERDLQTLGKRFRDSWKTIRTLWFSPLVYFSGARRQAFRHLDSGTGRLQQVVFAALAVLLTPFFLPVGAAGALLHALRKPRAHVHSANCSCHKGE